MTARKPATPWRPPTRRAFFAALGLGGAAAAALAIEHRLPRLGTPVSTDDDVEIDRPRSTWTGTTRWIGHC